MKTMDFVSYLQNLGVTFWIDGEQLRYRSPKGVITPELKKDIVERKGELLDLLREAQTIQQSVASSIQPISREQVIPLSYAQQRLWFIEKMALSSNAYNIPLTLHLVGKLDYVALQTTLKQIIARHETLRTTFSEINGTPVQIIQPPFELELPIQDLSGLTSSEQTTKLQQLLQQENELSFNLEVDPPIRAQLFKLGTTKHILQITLHHIAGDGWSVTVLPKELSAIYTATLEEQPSPLPELPIQYADFAVWQRNYLQGEILETQLNYWKQKLQDLPQLQLPTDHPRPAVQTFNGAGIPINIPAALTSKVKQLTQKQGTTLFMTLLAVFKVLLSRYSGQESVAVGTPIANRNRSEIEGLIGFFVNSLVMYTDLGGEPSFTEVLNRVKQTVLEAYGHQDIPFEKLVEDLQPERALSQNPLFQVMFAVQQSEIFKPSFSLPNLEIELDWERWMEEVRFDIELHLWPVGEEIKGFCAYNTDLFEAETISRMVSHYENLLSAAVETPERPISQLPLMTQPELDQILVEWNNTKTDYPKDKCIHQLFEEQVEKTPDAIAVVFEQQKLTYSQLNSKANQLAHYLQKLGVVPETLVGICVERSVEMVVGLLAILKAGGAYVPLDPNYPTSRLNYMVEDAQLSIILTQEKWQHHLSETIGTVICLDTDSEIINQQSQQMPENQVTANQLAYVIYTSGSTGQPKGVTIPHQGVVRLFSNTNYVQLEPTDRVAQVSNTSFDAATFEIWGALLHGAVAVVITKSVLLSPQEFVNYIKQEKITTLFLTTALFNQLAYSVPEAFSTLKHLLFGGEAVDPKSVKQVLEKGAPERLLHVYGPTENTTFSSWYKVTKVAEGATNMPIGKPISNTQIYILDSQLQPVPIGVAGELHIGGDGLAIGYHNRPELTASKFIPHPFDDSKIAKLYKTGDLCRYLADGNIEFIGRIDHQVKVRGYRIETGEIEATLTQNPIVKETVVLATEDNLGNKRIVAYLVLETETSVPEISETEQINKLKQYLKERLPEYMVPSGLMVLSQLPLTPNGKVDRKALPAPDLAISASTEYVAPETETQKALAEIWKEVLGIEQVGIHDNFFDLGGHSLMVTQVVSRVRQLLNIELPLIKLFENSDVASLAKEIEIYLAQSQPVETVAIQPREENENPPPLSFAQQRLWFIEKMALSSNAYNMPLTLHLVGKLDYVVLEKSINQIIARHETLRTTFSEIDGTPVQIIEPLFELKLPIIDLSELTPSEATTKLQQLLQQENELSFNLEVDPPIRAQLFQLGKTEHILQITLHHIASDGWSLTVLPKELSAIYTAALEDQPSPLPELPIQYADFAVWQKNYLQGETLETQLNYWKQKLQDLPQLQLPTDHPRPAVETFNGAGIPINIPATVTSKVKQLTQKQGSTLFMTLLAAFKVLMSRYSGQESIAVGTPIANRNRSEIEGLIGFFVNSLVMYTDLGGFPSFTEVLNRVKQTALEAYSHQDIPF
ncbi:amino acid adenylation domain-containing protein, partial [Moorena sp. SIO3F7]